MKYKRLTAFICSGWMLMSPCFAMADGSPLDFLAEEETAAPTEIKTQGETVIQDGDTLEDAIEVHNVDVWQVEDYELETMYGDPYVLRRAANTKEAWLVYQIPYVEEITVLSYSWPRHTVPFQILFSKDGETWEEKTVTVEEKSDDEEKGRWTRLYHHADSLYGMSYIKIVWPTELSENDWWNPYLGSISARIGVPKMERMKTSVPDKLVIPRYDQAEYHLEAVAVDQNENPMEAEILWQSKDAHLPQGITLLEDGTFVVAHDCTAERVDLTVSCRNETESLTAEVTVFLEAAKLGDVNYDNVVDELDLEFACQNYGKTSEDEAWEAIRLADIDGDGKIDIADLAYLAYQVGDALENATESKVAEEMRNVN